MPQKPSSGRPDRVREVEHVPGDPEDERPEQQHRGERRERNARARRRRAHRSRGCPAARAESWGEPTPARVRRPASRPTPPARRRRASPRTSTGGPAGSSATYCRSPYSQSVGSVTIRAPCDRRALAMRARIVDAHRDRGASPRLAAAAACSPRTSATMTAPSPTLHLRAVGVADPEPLLEAEGRRSSQPTASRTSG